MIKNADRFLSGRKKKTDHGAKNKHTDTNPMIEAEKAHFKFFLSYVEC